MNLKINTKSKEQKEIKGIDIDFAMVTLDGEWGYCKECNIYYLTKYGTCPKGHILKKKNYDNR
jgi:hypothetical protein